MQAQTYILNFNKKKKKKKRRENWIFSPKRRRLHFETLRGFKCKNLNTTVRMCTGRPICGWCGQMNPYHKEGSLS